MYLFAHRPVLAVIIAAVFAIGGCVPCQKLLAAESSQKSCCNSKGECQKPSPETPSKKTCNLQLNALQSEPQQHSERLADGTLADAGPAILDPACFFYSARAPLSGTYTDTSPPPLFLLNLSLLI